MAQVLGLRAKFAFIQLLLLCVTCVSHTASAQVDPRGQVRTVVTEHFAVHYPIALDSLAREAAVIAERAYAGLSKELSAPRGRVDMLLIDHVDDSNGFAQVFPRPRITIFAVPPVDIAELRFADDWLTLVITHELAHVFHLDRTRGVWQLGRFIFGRNPLFFPNTMTPSWVKEGLAVHYESLLTGSGRLVAPEFANMMRTAVRENSINSSSHWSQSASRYPRGQGVYAWGSLLMRYATEHAAIGASAEQNMSMRKFVDETAEFPVPFMLSRASRISFGATFDSMFTQLRDSVSISLTRDLVGDSIGNMVDSLPDGRRWKIVSRDGWYAGAPRWLDSASLIWTASTGRSVTSLFSSTIDDSANPVRVARRNSLDVNAVGNGQLIFAQSEYLDRWIIRSDLYSRNLANGEERRLTHGARLITPDVSRSGAIIAVQLEPNTSRLVRVDTSGSVEPILPAGNSRWAEPRWSPDGLLIAAIQALPTGEQRVVVLDSLGTLLGVVASGRGVFASPSFTPNSKRLVWSSDRSGRMQLETAAIELGSTGAFGWRVTSGPVTQLAASVSALYSPSISPDGRNVAALLLRADGVHVAVASLDTTGSPVSSELASARDSQQNVQDSLQIVVSESKPYRPFKQLLPSYWLPLVGVGRDGRSTFGVGSSGSDILGRHSWSASALLQPGYGEVDGAVGYSFAGYGNPVFDISLLQQWDGSFRVLGVDDRPLGLIARRKRFVASSATFSVPRYRWSMSNTVGAQLELRNFSADNDAALGELGSLLRTGTKYPSLFVSSSFSTARRAVGGISIEEGVSLSQSTSYRWGAHQVASGSWRSVVSARGFIPLSLPGYARHVIAIRAAAGIADARSTDEFTAGGAGGASAALLPGVVVGEPARLFQVRGYRPGSERGTRALAGGIEYRAPLSALSSAPSIFTLYFDRVSLALFADGARAWCPASVMVESAGVCNADGDYDGWLSSVGGELVVDAAVAYDMPLRLRFGTAFPRKVAVAGWRSASVYFTLGGYF